MNLVGFLLLFSLLILAVSVHEFAHGWTAYKLGDTTAKRLGRLTLNPIAHIDPIMTILLPLMLFIGSNGRFVFGAAKPVPVDFRCLRNPKKDILWIGASGPAANFIFALVLSIFYRFIPLPSVLGLILATFIYINLLLGVLNLLPIPPLDGSRIVMSLLPAQLAYRYAKTERFGWLIFILFLWLGILNKIVLPAVSAIMDLLKVSI
ncbi:site-2 protease family protein [Candidatus Omnitrophota bacterium]